MPFVVKKVVFSMSYDFHYFFHFAYMHSHFCLIDRYVAILLGTNFDLCEFPPSFAKACKDNKSWSCDCIAGDLELYLIFTKMLLFNVPAI